MEDGELKEKLKFQNYRGVYFPYLQDSNKFTPDIFGFYNYNYQLQKDILEELINICDVRNEFSRKFDDINIFNRGGEYIKLIVDTLEKSEYKSKIPENPLNEVVFIWIGPVAKIKTDFLVDWANIFKRVTLIVSERFIPSGSLEIPKCEVVTIESLFPPPSGHITIKKPSYASRYLETYEKEEKLVEKFLIIYLLVKILLQKKLYVLLQKMILDQNYQVVLDAEDYIAQKNHKLLNLIINTIIVVLHLVLQLQDK